MTLYTKPQLLRLLHGWGYVEGNLPKQTEPELLVYVPSELRTSDHTHAKLTYGPTNGAGHRLYGVKFVTL